MIELRVKANKGLFEVEMNGSQWWWGTEGVADIDSFRAATNFIELLLMGVQPEEAFRKAPLGLASYVR